MHKTLFLGGVLIAFVSLAALWYVNRRTDEPGKEPGFREYVKDPELFDELASTYDEADALAKDAESWSQEQIRQEIESYVFSSEPPRELWSLRNALQSLSPRTNEALISILSDEALQEKLTQLRKADFLQEAPIMRVCELFDGNLPKEAIPLLQPYLSHESDEIRKNCVLAIAESGLTESLPAIKQALYDEDEFVRSYALIGITRALENDQLSDAVRQGAIQDLKQLVSSDQNVEYAARLLARLDRPRAEAFLLTDSILDTDNRSLHKILGVIGQFDFKIPQSKVESLVQTYAKRKMEYPNNYALCESLALLGRFKSADNETVLEKYSDHSDELVSEGAMRGLVAFYGLEGFEKRIFESEEMDSLNNEQRMYVAVFWLNAEVNNGGHSQYFFNSAGNDWRLALEGLRKMGFKERLTIFEGVLDLFGTEKPLRDRGKRQDQLAKVYTDHENAFDEFDSRYYKSSEVVEVFAKRFVIENADKFK